MAADLRRLIGPGEVAPLPLAAVSTPRPRWRWRAAAVAALGLAVVAAMTTVMRVKASAPLTDRDSIVVASFTNTTGEKVFDETLSQALNVQLSQSPFLAIVPDRQIRETLRLMDRSDTTPVVGATARDVCKRSNVKAMLQPTIARVGSLYVVTLEAFECQTLPIDWRGRRQGRTQRGCAQGPRHGYLGRQAEARRDARCRSSRFRSSRRRRRVSTRCRPTRWAAPSARRARKSSPFRSSDGRWNWTTTSPPPIRCCRPVYGVLGELGQSEEHARDAYARRDRVSERERFLITYQYPRPRDRRSGRVSAHAGSVEGDLSARLRAGQRPGADLQSPWPVRACRRRGQRSAGASARPPVPVVEPRLRLSRPQ